MKKRLLQFSAILLIPVTILAVLLAVGTLAGATMSSTVDGSETVDFNTGEPQIMARRLTSIPYTVNSVLPLSPDGRTVQAGGPGTCDGVGDSFLIRVTVTQNGQQNRAMGVTEGDCATQNGWSVTATTPGSRTLVPGPAEVCGHAAIFGGPNGTLVGDWCVNVTLE